MVTDIRKLGTTVREEGVQGMIYRYDQLNRLVQSRSLKYSKPGAVAEFEARTLGAATAAHDELFSYDANGNLLTLKRYDGTGALQDDFNISTRLTTEIQISCNSSGS